MYLFAYVMLTMAIPFWFILTGHIISVIYAIVMIFGVNTWFEPNKEFSRGLNDNIDAVKIWWKKFWNK